MKQEHEAKLKMIADIIPSGGNVGLDNPHDLPNLVDWLVPLFLEHGSVHMDDARVFLIQNGQQENVANQVAYVIDVVDLTLKAVVRNS